MKLGRFTGTARVRACNCALILCVAVLAVLLCAPAARAAQREIRAGVYSFQPMVFVEKGAARGLFVDVLDHIAKEENWKVTYVPGNWPQTLQRLDNGEIDLILCIGYSEERARVYDYPKYFTILDWGMVYRRRGAKLNSLFDLNGKKIAVLKNSVYTTGFRTMLDQFHIQAKLVEKADYQEVFKAVASNESDAGICPNIAGLVLEENYPLEHTPIIFSPVQLSYAVRKGENSDIISALDRHLARMKGDPESVLNRKTEQWLGHVEHHLPREVLWGGCILAGGVVILSLFAFTLKRQVRARTRDIMAAQQDLYATSQRLQLATGSGHLGVWDLDLHTLAMIWDERMFELYGVTSKDGPYSVEIWLDALHPEDREGAMAEYQAALKGEREFDTVFRVCHPDGSLRHIKAAGVVIRDKDGAAVRMIGVNSDVSASKRSELERERLIQQLQDKTVEMERFIYTVSHDLKSPLITISGFLGFLEKDFANSDEARFKDSIGRIEQAALRMKQLLDELLEVSRIGRKMNQPERVPLGALVQEALEIIAGRVNETGARVEVAAELPVVTVDRQRLLQVFENLVDNAVKFSSGGPTTPLVRVGVRQDGEQPVIFVSDNGIGIEARHGGKVFELFEKLDPRSSGTGVGLAIVKRIVELHGGRIWVESEGLGKGTTFCLTLGEAKQ